ncbi:hypothetical protein KSC_002500 [Ktedonobacter sp. SOSP1-52]|nr:hypothetical protein KSC_002500 [Ktedonobacter sp. SOSP1-52]
MKERKKDTHWHYTFQNIWRCYSGTCAFIYFWYNNRASLDLYYSISSKASDDTLPTLVKTQLIYNDPVRGVDAST